MAARLPLNPNLGFYRKRAKELKRALSSRDENAAIRFLTHHPKFRRRNPADVFEAGISLADALLVIAREHGVASWTAFKKAVDQAAQSPDLALSDRLLAAVRAGDVQAVRDLCARHQGLARVPDSVGVIPLVEAADRDLLEVARVLLDAGADPAQGDPLLAAAHPGPHKRQAAFGIIDLLIARGLPDDIFVHALLGRLAAIREELPRVDVHARGPANSTALFLAAWNGQVDAARLLLEAGAEPNPVCRNGQSAWEVVFLHAWSAPHREVAKLLLSHGAPCSLHEACVLSHLPTVTRMLAADPELKDRPDHNGVTPLGVAIRKGDVELARVLLDAGADDHKGQGRVLVSAEPRQRNSFARSVFRNCSFETAGFHNCTLKDAVFSDINLSGATFENVNLSGATIDNARIRGLTIYGIDVEPLLVKELEKRAARKKTKT